MIDSREIPPREDRGPKKNFPLAPERTPALTQEEFSELMAQVKAGSVEAIWELLERYGGHILAVVRRHLNRRIRPMFDSTDFMQELFASVVRIRGRLDEFDTPQRLVAVLGTMARNKVIDEVRRRTQTARHGREDQVHLSTVPPKQHEALHSREPSPSQVAVAKEQWRILLATQSERDQRIVARRLEGKSMEEIAAEMAVHERTVRRVLERLLRERG